jgi:hypothetical protein
MRLTIVQLSAFSTKWSKLRLSDEDLRALEEIFLSNPEAGALIPGTGGLRKIRFAPPSWHSGKRGASRVISAYIALGSVVYLFTLYAKNEQSDLKPEEKEVFRKVLQRLRNRHENSKEQRHGPPN